MKRFVRFVGRLPFAGKIPIRNHYFGMHRAETDRERNSHYYVLNILFCLMTIGHGGQAVMSLYDLYFYIAPLWAHAIYLIYFLLNVMVIVTQVSLWMRVCGDYTEERVRTLHGESTLPLSDQLYATAVTIGIQAVFLWTHYEFNPSVS